MCCCSTCRIHGGLAWDTVRHQCQEWEHCRSLMLACLQSWTWGNFAGTCIVMAKSWMASVVCSFCSHIGMVSLAVLAAMSQAGRWQMRISNMVDNSVTESEGYDSVQTSHLTSFSLLFDWDNWLSVLSSVYAGNPSLECQKYCEHGCKRNYCLNFKMIWV